MAEVVNLKGYFVAVFGELEICYEIVGVSLSISRCLWRYFWRQIFINRDEVQRKQILREKRFFPDFLSNRYLSAVIDSSALWEIVSTSK